jgi:ribosomal protein S18 acetylase RimI-like enzyme
MPEIRKLEPDDFKYLLVIETESFFSGYSPYFIKMIPIIYSNTSFISVQGRSAQGYVAAALDQNNPQRAWILSLAVRPKYRGCSLGERLMLRALDSLQELKVQEILLSVAPENVQAVNLYKKLDFTEGKLIHDFFGPGEHRMLMKKTLTI